jgi:hypothetical protein
VIVIDAERSVQCGWPTAEDAGSVLKEVRVQGVQFEAAAAWAAG